MGNHLNVRDTYVFVTGILHILETIIAIVVCLAVVLGLGLITGILYGFGRDVERLLET